MKVKKVLYRLSKRIARKNCENSTLILMHPVIYLNHNKITLALDFSEIDNSVIQHAVSLENKETQYQFIHIVKSATAIVYGEYILLRNIK